METGSLGSPEPEGPGQSKMTEDGTPLHSVIADNNGSS